MLSFFDKISEFADMVLSFFVTIGTIISNFVSGLITAFRVLVGVVGIPAVFSALVPGIISAAIFIFISLAVVKFIVGR